MGKKQKTTQESNSGLSSFLLAQAEVKDDALANVFANSKGPSEAFTAPALVGTVKAKKSKKESKSKDKNKSKKGKEPTPPPATDSDDDVEEEEVDDEVLEPIEMDSDASLEMPTSDEDEDEEEQDSDDDDGVEQAYAAKLAAQRVKNDKKSSSKKRKAVQEEPTSEDEQVHDSDDESEGEQDEEEMIDADDLTHETLLTDNKSKTNGKESDRKDKKLSKKEKRAKADDTPEHRDARTVFLGNVPATCATSRPLKKALIRHVLQSPTLLELLPSDFPALKCDSIRFRSIAFASTVFGRKANEAAGDSEEGGRGRKRARDWRDAESSDQRGVRGGFHAKEEVPKPTSRSGALTDGQKRRVALFRGDLNEGKKTCNAYLVLEPIPTSSISDAELIKLIVQVVNGTVFEGFTLRADLVRPRSAAALVAAAQIAAKPDANIPLPEGAPKGPVYTVPPAEARRTIFIGGLDFAETEENVRSAIEAVLVREKGAAQGVKPWVEGVRLIRDASSGLGKGFGYVSLKDPSCVDELLALPAGKFLKVSKRKVRLERCKTGIAAARAKASASAAAKTALVAKKIGTPLAAPRDPSLKRPVIAPAKLAQRSAVAEKQARLAAELAALPAPERKAIKAIDPDRLARRADKKKNKILSERYERKMANAEKSGGILGRESRGEIRRRQEKKRVKEGNKTGKRAKKVV